MKQLKILIILLLLIAIPVSGASLLDGLIETEQGNTTASGVNGYVVIPSAEPAWSSEEATVTIGYSANVSGSGFSHIPYLQIGVNHDLEFTLAADIENSAALIAGGKWRIDKSGNRSLSFGVNGQLLQITPSLDWAAQIYAASTFSSSFIDWPSKTTLMLGYTLLPNLTSNIDYGMGFQTAFMKDIFSGKIDFILDFGNVSYSASPSISDADNRGMLNLGFRLLPIKLADDIYLSGDLRGFDILDASDRGVSLGIGFSYQP